MSGVVAFHPLSFDLAGLSPRQYDSPYIAPAEANVFVHDGDAYFACHEIFERADPAEDLSDRERFGVARVSAADPTQLESWWIEPEFPIEKTASSDAKRQGFVESVTATELAFDIGLTAWSKDGKGWGFQTESWRFDLARRKWIQGGGSGGDAITQPRVASKYSEWAFGEFDAAAIHDWWRENDQRIDDTFSLLHPIVLVPMGDLRAIWARAIAEYDCYKMMNDKFVSALFVVA